MYALVLKETYTAVNETCIAVKETYIFINRHN